MSYTPRKQSKRWLDGDCPNEVLAIYRDKRFTDEYTVFYKTPVAGDTYSTMWLGYRGMSENPFHPQGVGMYSEMRAYNVASYRYESRNRAFKWSDLPEKVKECVKQDCE